MRALRRAGDARRMPGRTTPRCNRKAARDCWMRLVEQPAHPDFKPTRTYGWAAFECTVQDVWGWPDRLPPDQFRNRRPAQGNYRYRTCLHPDAGAGAGARDGVSERGSARHAGDRLAARRLAGGPYLHLRAGDARSRPRPWRWYADALGLDRGADFTIPYSMINNAFGLPADTLTTLTMVSAGRMPVVEVDDYPQAATAARHAMTGTAAAGQCAGDARGGQPRYMQCEMDQRNRRNAQVRCTRGDGRRRLSALPENCSNWWRLRDALAYRLLMLAFAAPAQAAPDPPRAIIEQAIAAHGGEGWLEPGTLVLERVRHLLRTRQRRAAPHAPTITACGA